MQMLSFSMQISFLIIYFKIKILLAPILMQSKGVLFRMKLDINWYLLEKTNLFN